MQQITLDKPGQFSRRDDAPRPTPDAGEALVRVHRIGVCGTDLHAHGGRQPFFDYPRVLGHELGVEVVQVGENERGIRVGDCCAVEPYLNCGACIACRRGKPNCCARLNVLGVHVDGGMRPWLNVPIDKLHPSRTLTLDQLALVETLCIGAHAVERAEPAADEHALVIGAGPIGLGVIQSLIARGVTVTVMDLSEARLRFCRDAVGVTRTVHPEAGDIDAQLRAHGDGELPTAVFDATGNARSMMGAFERVAHGGRLVLVGLVRDDLTFHDPELHKRELTLHASRNATPATFRRVIESLEAGRIDTTPWITRRLALAQVPDEFAALHEDERLIKAVIEVDDG